ncbi:MAG: hypothetical protein M3Q57_09685 [Pseudomonadota bacterium]|nr:hypothetical protein [Pseudomonadota bacterium]
MDRAGFLLVVTAMVAAGLPGGPPPRGGDRVSVMSKAGPAIPPPPALKLLRPEKPTPAQRVNPGLY